MSNSNRIVINTSPLISIVAAMDDLKILAKVFDSVIVPFEVCNEIMTGGKDSFAVNEFTEAIWLTKWDYPLSLNPLFINTLDVGEAAVIQLALDQHISTVCIDESVGRRIARLSGLNLTGTIGILLRAQYQGIEFSMENAVAKMINRGIWISEKVKNFAIEKAIY